MRLRLQHRPRPWSSCMASCGRTFSITCRWAICSHPSPCRFLTNGSNRKRVQCGGLATIVPAHCSDLTAGKATLELIVRMVISAPDDHDSALFWTLRRPPRTCPTWPPRTPAFSPLPRRRWHRRWALRRRWQRRWRSPHCWRPAGELRQCALLPALLTPFFSVDVESVAALACLGLLVSPFNVSACCTLPVSNCCVAALCWRFCGGDASAVDAHICAQALAPRADMRSRHCRRDAAAVRMRREGADTAKPRTVYAEAIASNDSWKEVDGAAAEVTATAWSYLRGFSVVQ